MAESFLDRIVAAPAVYDASTVAAAWDRLTAGPLDPHRRASSPAKLLLDGVFGASPFLTRLILSDPEVCAGFLQGAPERQLEALLAHTRAAADAPTKDELKHSLRQAKARAALLTGLCDLAGVWDVEAVTAALTRFADAAVETALGWLMREAGASDDGLAGSGYVLIAMGKYGAFELNYSSDIDLIALFDPDTFRTGGGPNGRTPVHITRDLVNVLQDQTEHGYVFRTDLRLRPDPGSTAIAVSFPSAERYYEALGQNWERAAFIKARACAGDIEAGEAFLSMLQPFIWRKYLDYAAIEDVHSIKRQIHASGKHGPIAVEGHNIKLGRGGIREIEFFVQTQQLILGGRIPELRERQTVPALFRLSENGLITPSTAEEMANSYAYLRSLEHRLQMIADEQTHTLPKTADGVDRVARLSGESETRRFREQLLFH
ncbi:MAG: bifunctional [glutamine synthetase] adenylyltransferase/[glutamine synthetase]-adenylyl-L-tyrosine phosphorylase, partial [Pseudomonadota bacterium]